MINETNFNNILVTLQFQAFVIKETRKCNVATDCHDNECCVSNDRPIGKRQTTYHGHCVPLGAVGDGE